MPAALLSPIAAPPVNLTPGTRIVAEFPKNRREVVSASLGVLDNQAFASLRVRVPTPSGGSTFTQKGLSLSVALLPALRRAVTQLEDAARAAGYLPDGSLPDGSPPRAA